jgi:hypothetical protein
MAALRQHPETCDASLVTSGSISAKESTRGIGTFIPKDIAGFSSTTHTTNDSMGPCGKREQGVWGMHSILCGVLHHDSRSSRTSWERSYLQYRTTGFSYKTLSCLNILVLSFTSSTQVPTTHIVQSTKNGSLFILLNMPASITIRETSLWTNRRCLIICCVVSIANMQYGFDSAAVGSLQVSIYLDVTAWCLLTMSTRQCLGSSEYSDTKIPPAQSATA